MSRVTKVSLDFGHAAGDTGLVELREGVRSIYRFGSVAIGGGNGFDLERTPSLSLEGRIQAGAGSCVCTGKENCIILFQRAV